MLLRVRNCTGAGMILSTMNDLPGIGQEICAYGTAVKIGRADS
jgi:hypothetical protein